MADLNETVLKQTIAKLGSKLARQQNSVAETQQHIAAIEQLITQRTTKK